MGSILKVAYQNIIGNIRAQFNSAAREYDNDRFQEINEGSEVDGREAQQIEGMEIAAEANEKVGNKTEQKATIEKSGTKSRRQPKRKAATTKAKELEGFSSDDMEVLSRLYQSYVPTDSSKTAQNSAIDGVK